MRDWQYDWRPSRGARLFVWCAALAGASGAAPGGVRADLQFQAFDARRHSRFHEGSDKAFLGDEQKLDFSGVGHSTVGECWATMITRQYFVSVTHAAPAPGTRLVFFAGNAKGKGRREYVVLDGGPIVRRGVKTDLFLGRLTEPIPTSHRIASYPVFVLPRDGSYRGGEILVYGRPDYVGRNIIERVGDLSPKPTRLMYFAFHPQGGCGPDDAYPRTHDSGAPSFVVWKRALALVGVHSGNSTRGGDGTAGSLGADVFLPHYLDELNSAMRGGQVEVAPSEREFFETPDAADRARQRTYFYATACGMAGILIIAIAVWVLRRPAAAE